MSITRSRLSFESHFTTVPNSWVRDPRISRKAKGIMIEVMSHAPGWQITVESLVKNGTEGIDAIRSGIIELEKAGYLVRSRVRDDQGKMRGVDYLIVDPFADGDPQPPEPEEPKRGKPTVDNPTLGDPLQRRTVLKEDQFKEDQKNPADPSDQAVLFPDERTSEPKEDAAPEEVIARRAYDATKGALNFMAVRGIAKWAIHTRKADPAQVEEAMAQLYQGARSITKTSVGQWLDGHIKPAGQGRPSRMDENLSVVEQLRLEEQTQQAALGRQLTTGGRR